MSGPSSHAPSANPALIPTLATVTYLASLIALWGVLSLALDRDVIDYRDAGPLLGPTIALAGCVVTFVASWRHRGWASTVSALMGCLAAMVLVGAIGYTLTRGDLSWLLLAGGYFATSPFILGAAVLCALVVGGAGVIRR